MKRISLLILFFGLLSIGTSQTVISGNIVENRSGFLDPAPGLEVYIDSIYKSFSDLDGTFIFSIPENYKIDTLKFKAKIYYDFAITNLPTDYDTINLGTISCFEYSYDYYSEWVDIQLILDYKPKKRNKKKKKILKSEQEYYAERNEIIEQYEYELRGAENIT